MTAASPVAHVRFANVSKRYGTAVQAVKNLDLDVMRGEFLTLLGPSGSGKTTALMMLAGFEEPTGGEILVDGKRIDNVPPNRRGIGMVFQNYALFPHMTVAENLAFPLDVRRFGRAEIAERVAAVLDMVRLPGLGDRRPDQLSGGQQQRIAVARALIFRPTLVLMDEPLGALDKQLREQMQYEIKDIHARLGVTFIYVTHDQTEALTMSDRIAVFDGGMIQQLTDPATLYERPQTRFVAGFVGENNRLDGMVETVEGQHVAVRLASGSKVRALAVGKGAVRQGAPVVLSLRPERLALLASDAQAENTLAVTIRQIVYVGDHIRVVCAIVWAGEPKEQLIIKIPNQSGALELAPGAPAKLGWRTEDCLALDP